MFLSDVIIGAPHDGPDLDGDGVGNGAIYIYYGSKNGDIGKYYQVYKIETFPNYARLPLLLQFLMGLMFYLHRIFRRLILK